ncbi:hypothetical protein CONLIGDRAFT_514057 [Coniochaeta ligniaria NRRL 30616]|uniref:Uncharacterized protein n=1 Tax=Coniochaeta ligniaria NRRL 30616 TaxID=1408157 RepID=A0A1J7JEG3_9PEZI|nr:hypothetical protein CONLIGDRAFT_514057 [Coniochaeta ligniaria NRRL 30616]
MGVTLVGVRPLPMCQGHAWLQALGTRIPGLETAPSASCQGWRPHCMFGAYNVAGEGLRGGEHRHDHRQASLLASELELEHPATYRGGRTSPLNICGVKAQIASKIADHPHRKMEPKTKSGFDSRGVSSLMTAKPRAVRKPMLEAVVLPVPSLRVHPADKPPRRNSACLSQQSCFPAKENAVEAGTAVMGPVISWSSQSYCERLRHQLLQPPIREALLMFETPYGENLANLHF